MRVRFQKGDLAITIHSRVPLLQNGLIVRILEVLGPIPELRVEFGYRIVRTDGQPFVLTTDGYGVWDVGNHDWCIAHQWQLWRIPPDGASIASMKSKDKGGALEALLAR